MWKLKILIFKIITKLNKNYLFYQKMKYKFGITDSKGAPKKCYCGNNKFKKCNEDYIESNLMEYDIVCSKCNCVLSHYTTGYYCD